MRIEIHTDGSCEENGRVNTPGGWAVVLRSRVVRNGVIMYPHEGVVKGAKWATTSLEMELTAIYEGLKCLNDNALDGQVHIYTDCQEASDICQKKYRTWMNEGWVTRLGKPIAERPLIEGIVAICRKFDPVWHWVKSHVDNDLNNRVDEIARDERLALVAQYKAEEDDGEKEIPLTKEEREMVIHQLRARSEFLNDRMKQVRGRPHSRHKVAEIAETQNLMRQVIRKLY